MDKPAALDEAILESASLICDALRGRLLVFHARIPWEDSVHLNPALGRVPELMKEDVHAAYCDMIDGQVAHGYLAHG